MIPFNGITFFFFNNGLCSNQNFIGGLSILKSLKTKFIVSTPFLVAPVFMDLDTEGSFWIASYLNLSGFCLDWVQMKVYQNMTLRM
ncbi:hypothetical protein DZC72_15060 [Maribacter algicola]|uniref:Uncharacterized protein n=1 Tax=Maribacter algicola TaxID=2498892 RepID=A0A3R8PZ92_9FLAO|nr:hypothetical protein DZC72_15060 [Maribacter algicola]